MTPYKGKIIKQTLIPEQNVIGDEHLNDSKQSAESPRASREFPESTWEPEPERELAPAPASEPEPARADAVP